MPTVMGIHIPIVICGKCFNIMDINEWLSGFETDVGNFVPHPNSSHRCDYCGFLWEPKDNVAGDKMISDGDIMFFWDESIC